MNIIPVEVAGIKLNIDEIQQMSRHTTNKDETNKKSENKENNSQDENEKN